MNYVQNKKTSAKRMKETLASPYFILCFTYLLLPHTFPLFPSQSIHHNVFVLELIRVHGNDNQFVSPLSSISLHKYLFLYSTAFVAL